MIDEIQIQNWLADEGMFRQRIHDDNNFHFLINFPQDNSMDIFQPKGRNDLLIIGCATQVSPMEQDIIHNSKKSKNQEFIWDLRFELNRMFLDFQLQHPNDELQSFLISDVIYEDGLSKNELINTIKKVFKGKLQCIWLLGRTYGAEIASEKPMDVQNNDTMFM